MTTGVRPQLAPDRFRQGLGGKENAVHPVLLQHLHLPRHIMAVVFGAGDQQTAAGLARDLAGALHDAGGEGVEDVGNDEAEAARTARGEAAGDGAGPVVKLAHDLQDALAGFGRDNSGVVEHVADRANRYPGLAGDLTNGGHVHHVTLNRFNRA